MATVPTIPFPVQARARAALKEERGICGSCWKRVPIDASMEVYGFCELCLAKADLVDTAVAIRSKGSDQLIMLAAALLARLRDEPAVGFVPDARRRLAEGMDRAVKAVRNASYPRPRALAPEEIEIEIESF